MFTSCFNFRLQYLGYNVKRARPSVKTLSAVTLRQYNFCSITACLFFLCFNWRHNEMSSNVLPPPFLLFCQLKVSGLSAEPRCAEWNRQPHMAPSVQRTPIAGNRKNQLACAAILSRVHTVVLAGFPTDRCHLDVFKWVVIYWSAARFASHLGG